jgi:hypothetical protein
LEFSGGDFFICLNPYRTIGKRKTCRLQGPIDFYRMAPKHKNRLSLKHCHIRRTNRCT